MVGVSENGGPSLRRAVVVTRKLGQDGFGEVADYLVITFTPLLGGGARVHIQDGADQTVGLFALFRRQ